MARLKLHRFRVRPPTPEAAARYLRLYPSADLHFRPETVLPISAEVFFGVRAPLVLDLGCGRGEFIVAQAQARPAEYFVGIDWHEKSVWDAVNRAQSAGVDNLRIVRADLRLALPIVPDAAAAELYVLFPPVVLTHAKRQHDFLTAATIAQLARILRPGGWLHFVTDSPAYFNHKLALFVSDGRFVVEATAQGFEGGQTRFQALWEAFDIRSNRAVLRRLGDS